LVGGDEGRKVGLTVRPSLADRGGSEERRRRARQEAGVPFMVGTGRW
jgi:hypothetical protein